MFSIELTQRQNKALKKRKEILQESPEVNIHLGFVANLMAKKKNSCNMYKEIERSQKTICQYVM